MKAHQNLYVIDYYLSGTVKETINLKNPKPLIVTKWEIMKLQSSTHKLGKLIRRKI